MIKCFVWSVTLYAAETWTLTKADRKWLPSDFGFGEGCYSYAKDWLEGESNKCICTRKRGRRKTHVE